MKSKNNVSQEPENVIHVHSRMCCPTYQSNGKWTTIIKEFDEDIPDLGRDELICNKCGFPTYPECKKTICQAWVYHKSNKT